MRRKGQEFPEQRTAVIASRGDHSVIPKECTLGELLRQTRLRRGLSLRKVAFIAGFTPTYLSLLERDACGPPSDEKIQALAEALGEPDSEIFFAKAGRAAPRVVNIILRHPKEWSELLEAGKDLVADHIDKVKEVIVIGHRKQAAAAFRAIRRHRHSSGASAPLMRARRLGEERPGQGEVDAFDLRAIVEKAEKIEEVHKRALFKAAGGKCQMKQVTPHLKIQVTDPARRARGWQLFDESMVYGTCPPL